MTFTPTKGYIEFRRLFRGDYSHMGETRWFWTAGREFGLWYLTVHAFGLYFSMIGPFQFRTKEQAHV